jgi:hypothetical protein
VGNTSDGMEMEIADLYRREPERTFEGIGYT